MCVYIYIYTYTLILRAIKENLIKICNILTYLQYSHNISQYSHNISQYSHNSLCTVVFLLVYCI